MYDDRDEGLRELGILICALLIVGVLMLILTAILWCVQ